MECTLYMADGCNLQCKYCYQGIDKNKKIMNYETAKQSIDFIVNNLIDDDDIYITFLGGEPLLNSKMISKIICYIGEEYNAIRDRFRFSITTNGTLLNEEMISLFKKFKFRTSISMDGTFDTQQLNRKGCTFDMYNQLLVSIKKMIKEGIDYNIRMTVTSNNAQYLFQNIEYFYNQGIKRYDIGFDFFTGWDETEIECLDNELKKIDEFYLEHEKEVDLRINILDDKLIPHITKRNQCYCNAGSTSHFVVSSNGDIYPCTYVVGDKEWKLGNVWEGIENSKLWSKIKCSVKNPSPCKTCEISALCIGGQCGFMNYSLSGFLNHPVDVECRIEKMLYHHQKNVIIMLKKGGSKRIEDLLDIAEKYNIELSKFIKAL